MKDNSPTFLQRKLAKGLQELNIPHDKTMLGQFTLYFQELVKWNNKINLTSIVTPEEVVIKHFLDSAAYIKAIPAAYNEKVLDIGCGGGFPGIPLKILLPQLQLEVADSRNKKLEFIKHLARILPLEGLKYLWLRCEKKTAIAKYNIVISRACLAPVDFFQLAQAYLVPGGKAILSEGADSAQLFNQKFPQALQAEKAIIQKIPGSNLTRTLLIATKAEKNI